MAWHTSDGAGRLCRSCIGIVEHDTLDTLMALLAVNKIGAVAYFIPAGVNGLRRRFLCESASVSRPLDASAGDLNLPGASDELEARQRIPYPEVVQRRTVVRVHLRHASGKLIPAEVDRTALLRRGAA